MTGRAPCEGAHIACFFEVRAFVPGVMKMLAPIALVTLAAACGGPEGSLPTPDTKVAPQFVQERYLTDDAIADVPTEADRLAAQLLGEAPKPAVAARVARRPIVRPAPEPTEDFEEELPWSLSESSFLSTLANWSGVKTCVRAQRATSGGALRVALDITNTGDVQRARVLDTSNALASAVAPCVARKARLLDFPAFESDEEVTRIAKFVF
jgi:hypothetical protein